MMPRPLAHISSPASSLPHRVPMTGRPVIRVLPGVPESAAAARQVARQLLGDGHPAADTAMLLVSELVTNSVLHSKSGGPGGTVTVAICVGATSVLIQVRDDGGSSEPRLPTGQANVIADAAASAEHGYGLLLVDALAETWGTISTNASRVTWCRLAVGDARSAGQPDPDGRAMDFISVVSVPVSDQGRAKSFYLDRVGFSLIAEATFGDELRWIQVGIPGAQTSLTLVTWFIEMPPGSLRGLVIDCADLEQDYQALKNRGVPFMGPPSRQPGGVFATFSDPDGNVISLRQAGS